MAATGGGRWAEGGSTPIGPTSDTSVAVAGSAARCIVHALDAGVALRCMGQAASAPCEHEHCAALASVEVVDSATGTNAVAASWQKSQPAASGPTIGRNCLMERSESSRSLPWCQPRQTWRPGRRTSRDSPASLVDGRMVSCRVMPMVRRQLSRLVGVWLVVQSSMLFGVSATICTGHDDTATAQSCACAHGDGSQCPMHHPTPATHAPCTCHSAPATNTATLATVFGPAAVLTSLTATRISVIVSTMDPATEQASVNPPAVVDPPPPRG